MPYLFLPGAFAPAYPCHCLFLLLSRWSLNCTSSRKPSVIIRPWLFLLWTHFSPANSSGTCPLIVWPPIFLSKLPEGGLHAHVSLCLHLPYCPGSRLILDIIMEAYSSWGFSSKSFISCRNCLVICAGILDGEAVHSVFPRFCTPYSWYVCWNEPSCGGHYCGDEVAQSDPRSYR